MAFNLARLCLSNFGLLPRRLMPAVNAIMPKRTIVDNSELRMDSYLRLRVAFNERLMAANSNREKYVAKLSEQMSDEKSTVFSEDLNTLLTVAETKEDAALAVKMLKRLHAQIKAGVGYAEYHFGPILMRMFHYLRLPEEAYSCYRDQTLKDSFANVISATVLLDILFENGKFNEMIEAYELLKNKYPDWHYPRTVTFLYIAALYKANTQETFEKVKSVVTDAQRQKATFFARTAAVSALMGLKFKNPEFTSECERLLKFPERSSIMLNVRVLKALDQANNEQVVALLDFIRRQFAGRRQAVVATDVIKGVDNVIAKLKQEPSNDTNNLSSRLEVVRKEVSNDNLLDTKTLEELIFTPLMRTQRPGNAPGARSPGSARRYGQSAGPVSQGGFGPRRFVPGQSGPSGFSPRRFDQGNMRQGGQFRDVPQGGQFRDAPQGGQFRDAPQGGQFRDAPQGGQFRDAPQGGYGGPRQYGPRQGGPRQYGAVGQGRNRQFGSGDFKGQRNQENPAGQQQYGRSQRHIEEHEDD